jgi:hypothetical protein
VALDPIVSLSVALAEAPGSCACLLGAGVSVDAGVPTGWAVFRDVLRRLYRVERATDATPDDEALDAWLAETGRAEIGYSTLLDEVAPDPATRRDLLAGYFEAREPGPTHELLADLAAQGVVRVFVTTNFDRLLERALVARGVEPVVVSDDATLHAQVRREHARVFVVKAHGDYLQQTMRNTPSELAELEPQLTAELRAIADHYGLLVLGWSGADPAIAEVLRARRSRYGTWWLSLADPPAEPGRSLAEAIGARVIVREGAAVLLRELRVRLDAYAAHPSGNDPASVHDATLALVRRDDDVGLDGVLRAERFAFEHAVDAVTRDHLNHHDDPAVVDDAAGRLVAATDRRLASLLPLALHRPEALGDELRAHASWASRSQLRSGGMTWQEAWRLPFWMLGQVLGAVALRLERFAALRAVLAVRWVNHYGEAEPLTSHPGEASLAVAQRLGPPAPAGSRWTFPQLNWLMQELHRKAWLVERYPEWLRREGEPQRGLTELDLVATVATSLRPGEGEVLALWSLDSVAATGFARQLHRDARLREAVAEAAGTDLATFDARAPEIIAAAQGLGPSPRVGEVAAVLRSGARA